MKLTYEYNLEEIGFDKAIAKKESVITECNNEQVTYWQLFEAFQRSVLDSIFLNFLVLKFSTV